RVEMEQFEAAFLDRQEIAAEDTVANARPSKRHRDRRDDAAWPRAHHMDLVGEIDRLLDVVGDEQHGLAEVAHSCISHSCILSLVWASSAPNGSSSRMTSVSNSNVRNNAARWRMPPESALG